MSSVSSVYKCNKDVGKSRSPLVLAWNQRMCVSRPVQIECAIVASSGNRMIYTIDLRN